MFKFFDRLDDILDGRTKPTRIETIFLALMIPTILATIFVCIWLLAAIAELYK